MSDPDSGFGGPESDSGSGGSHKNRMRSAVNVDTMSLGRPLKGILKNNQCSTLPRQNCSCEWICEEGVIIKQPNGSTNSTFGCHPAELLNYSPNLSSDTNKIVNKNEVIDNVESSV